MERQDVHAAVEARRELGPAYEDAIVDALLAKIEQRQAEPPARDPATIVPIVLGSLFFGVGATAVAAGNGAAWLAAIVWVAIAAIDVAVLRYR